MQHQDFALQDKKLFPLTNRGFTKVSSELFDAQKQRLSVKEQLTGARKIAAACKTQGIRDSDAQTHAEFLGDQLSSTFDQAMALHKHACVGGEKRIDQLAGAAKKIASQKDPVLRQGMLDALCEKIAEFDKAMGIDYARHGVAPAVDTVYRNLVTEDDGTKTATLREDAVYVGARAITATDLARLDKTAASTLIVPGTMAKAANLAEFAKADSEERALIASFIP